jgi:hypothetical protein
MTFRRALALVGRPAPRPAPRRRCYGIHGLDATDTADAPTFAELWPQLESWLAGSTVVAHNAGGRRSDTRRDRRGCWSRAGGRGCRSGWRRMSDDDGPRGGAADDFGMRSGSSTRQLTPHEALSTSRVDGGVSVTDFNRRVDAHIDPGRARSIGGIVFQHFGRLPATGDSFELDGVALTVERLDGHRIAAVRTEVHPEPSDFANR